jgi:DNA-binding NarL/FixJ family response regulator
MTEERSLLLLVVSDDALVRAGLSSLLVDEPGVQAVRESDGDGAMAAATTAPRVDAVVLASDVEFEPEEQSEITPMLRESGFPVVVLVPDKQSAEDYLASGASGALSRDTPPAAIVAALNAAALGLVVVADAWADVIPSRQTDSEAQPIEELTERELQVLSLLSEGLSNREIASRLDISEHTAKFHVNSILGKLSAASRTEAAIKAARLGLIHL